MIYYRKGLLYHCLLGKALFLHSGMLGIHLGFLLLLPCLLGPEMLDYNGARICGNGRGKEEQMLFIGYKNVWGFST